MKKTFLLLILSIFSLSLLSQNLSVPSFGIKVGSNYSNLNFSQYNYMFFGLLEATEGYAKPSTSSNIGVKGGVFLDIKIGAKWYISPTISYSQFGASTKLNRTFDVDTIRTYGEETREYKMDYVSLDPNFEYRVNDVFTLIAGPSISYLISNNLEKTVTNTPQGQNEDYNGEIEGVSEIDAGINIGTSFFITKDLDVDLSIYIGIIDLENVEDGYNRFNQSTNLSIGYKF